MLSAEKNKLLTEVGPATPMGDYLRRYWHPIAGEAEFENKHIRPIRLFGEDLVLYKDLSGAFGLIQRHCPHRSADLRFGYVEQCGIRCSYHGWEFDRTGQCTHQPFEETMDPEAKLRKRTKAVSYEVRAKGGALWAYMGPLPAPELPDWDFFNYEHGFVQIVMSELDCNWFQCQENSIDPIHFEWTHNNWSSRQQDPQAAYVPTHLKVEFEEFDYGFIYRRLRAGEHELHPQWTIGRVVLWPNAFYLGHHVEYRVPIDDTHTLSLMWIYTRVPKEREPYVQASIPCWYGPLYDQNGDWIKTHVGNQDFAAWIGQGPIVDRSKETLGASDRGVAMMRRRFFEELDAVAAGKQPKALITDGAANTNVILPSIVRDDIIAGLYRDELVKHPLLGPWLLDMIEQEGQPEAVRLAQEAATGEKMRGAKFFSVHGSGADKKG
jgi:5,5'-dehydrodivanillate O-demethylase